MTGQRGPAWAQMRRQLMLVSSALLIVGGALLLLGMVAEELWPLVGGIVLMGSGALLTIARPWNYLKRLEVQAAAHRQGLALGPRGAHYGPADAHWHHGSEDGHSPGLCQGCGMLLDSEGRCRLCEEEATAPRPP